MQKNLQLWQKLTHFEWFAFVATVLDFWVFVFGIRANSKTQKTRNIFQSFSKDRDSLNLGHLPSWQFFSSFFQLIQNERVKLTSLMKMLFKLYNFKLLSTPLLNVSVNSKPDHTSVRSRCCSHVITARRGGVFVQLSLLGFRSFGLERFSIVWKNIEGTSQSVSRKWRQLEKQVFFCSCAVSYQA